MEEYQLLFIVQSILYLLVAFVVFAFSVILLAKKKNIAGVLMTFGSGIGLLVNAYRQLYPYLAEKLGIQIGEDFFQQQAYIGLVSLFFYTIFMSGVCTLIINYTMPSKK